MPNYIQDILARLVAMEEEALGTITSGAVDAKPFWPWEQESFPYFTNRWGPMTNDPSKYSEDIEDYEHSVLVLLVVAHWNEGFVGEAGNKVALYAPLVESYFRQHPMLTTSPTGLYPDDADYLLEAATLSGHNGINIFQNAGINALQYGVQFTLALPYLRDAEN